MAAASPILSSNLSPIIIDIRNILTTLSNLHLTTRLVWIPGHRGISGNEIADSCQIGYHRRHPLWSPPSSIRIFYHREIKIYRCHQSLVVLSASHGASERTGSTYFKIFFNPSPIALFSNIEKIDRKRIVTFSRMRSNHYNLAASLFRKNMNHGVGVRRSNGVHATWYNSPCRKTVQHKLSAHAQWVYSYPCLTHRKLWARHTE